MSQPGTNKNKINTATGATVSNTIINAAANNTTSTLKQETIVWKYKGYLAQMAYKSNYPEAIWKRCVLFKDLNLVFPAIGTLVKLWESVNKTEPTVKSVSDHIKILIQEGEPWTEKQIAKDTLKIYIKLSKTSPEIFGTFLTEKGSLVKNEETIFWSAAVDVFGENFQLAKELPMPIAEKLRLEKKSNTKKLTWDLSFNGVPSQSTNYLNGKKQVRPPKQAKTDPKNKQKNTTFFCITVTAGPDVKSFLKAFRRIFDIVTEVDKKAIILPKPDSPDGVAAITNPETVTTSRHLSRFTAENLWVRPEIPTAITLLIGHDEKAIDFISDQFSVNLSEFEASIKICNIQSLNQVCLGWMIGSYPEMDPQFMAELYRINPKLKNYDLDCKFELVKMSPNEKYNKETAARAMFIYCKEEDQENVTNALKSLYNKRCPPHHPGTSYPDGRAMKFVPGNYGLATTIGPTQAERELFIKRKQIQIGVCQTARTHKIRINGLLEADVSVPINNPAVNGVRFATIKQILMAIKSKQDYVTPVISGIDLVQKPYEDPYYVATYYPGFREEVETIFNHLPVYLAAHYGSKIWKCFSVPHKMRMKEFFFDRETNTVVAGTSAEELQDDLYLDDQYAEMYGVSCSLENCEISSQKKMHFDLSKMFNLELIPDSNNILADDNGSTGTALTGVSAVTEIMQARKGEDDHSKTNKDCKMKDDDNEEMEKVDKRKSQYNDNHQKNNNTNDGSKKDDKDKKRRRRPLFCYVWCVRRF